MSEHNNYLFEGGGLGVSEVLCQELLMLKLPLLPALFFLKAYHFISHTDLSKARIGQRGWLGNDKCSGEFVIDLCWCW